VTSLADAVLPLIRTRSDLSRRGAANEHGRRMHEALELLESARTSTPAPEFYKVVHAALASAVKVIARADDSSGIIGHACRRLLALHPDAAAAARVPASRLVDWMIQFEFDGDVDYFELDPVAYAPALGDTGLLAYRARLDTIRSGLTPLPVGVESWRVPDRHERFVLDWNDQRLAVLDRDIQAIIRTHARDRKVAAWFEDTARAFEEIGEIDLAIDWAKQATDHDRGHQALHAGEYWCELLARHRPDEQLPARLEVFRRWPTSSTAARLHQAAASSWPDYSAEVFAALGRDPWQAVVFSLHHLKNTRLAWQQAHDLGLDDDRTWSDLAAAYEPIDPAATLPVHCRLVEHDLEHAGAQHYQHAARRLVRMRRIATTTGQLAELDAYIAELRELHRRRPRLQHEFDKARLP
jgi:hypothetical protein